MLPKLIAVVACVILLLGLGARGLLNNGVQKKENVKWAEQNSLKEIARRSKAEGKGTVTISGPWSDYPGVDMKLEEALRDYSVVVAEVIANKSYPINSDGVRTWYKFKIIDPLSEKYAHYCHTCPEIPEAPEDLSPINSDEFLLAIGGGTVNVDGVEVTVNNRSLPAFESGKRYVLVVSLTPSRVALLGAGPSGVFRVDENERLEAVDNGNRPMQAEISQRFAGKLSNLKAHMKR
jgi:hypothetical protein